MVIRRIVITLLLLVLLSITAQAGGLSKDAANTWRINTLPQEQRNIPHMMMGKVYRPNEGVIWTRVYGPTDTWECASDLSGKKIEARDISLNILDTILSAIGPDYVISMAVSVCHPDWFVIYIHTGQEYVSRDILETAMKALNIK